MALLGNAAVAMWWNVAPEARSEFEDWHSHEHMPERLRIPGFLRGTRWTSPSGEGDYFVIYELAEYETLTSKHYLDRLNSPTPWSTMMMPQHRNMTRSQCRVLCSHGGMAGINRFASPLPTKDPPSTTARSDSQPPSIGRLVSRSATRRPPKAADGKKGARGSRTVQEPLSRAQLRVLGLLNRGLTNQEIAKELEIGVGTIRWHLNNIFGKLQVRNRTEAIVRARELS